MLYFTIISIAMLVIYAYTLPVGIFTDFISLKEALIGPMFVNAYVLVIMGVVTMILRMLPYKVWNAESKIFIVDKKEIGIYEKLQIKKWKDKVPEMGHTTGNFPKRNIASMDNAYLKRFLSETCISEKIHSLSILFSFSVLFFVPLNGLIYAVPVLVINMVLHLMPCFIQRFVRFRLLKIYNHQLLKENN